MFLLRLLDQAATALHILLQAISSVFLALQDDAGWARVAQLQEVICHHRILRVFVVPRDLEGDHLVGALLEADAARQPRWPCRFLLPQELVELVLASAVKSPTTVDERLDPTSRGSAAHFTCLPVPTRRDLANMSLVCHAWRPVAQRLLWSRITLANSSRAAQWIRSPLSSRDDATTLVFQLMELPRDFSESVLARAKGVRRLALVNCDSFECTATLLSERYRGLEYLQVCHTRPFRRSPFQPVPWALRYLDLTSGRMEIGFFVAVITAAGRSLQAMKLESASFVLMKADSRILIRETSVIFRQAFATTCLDWIDFTFRRLEGDRDDNTARTGICTELFASIKALSRLNFRADGYTGGEVWGWRDRVARMIPASTESFFADANLMQWVAAMDRHEAFVSSLAASRCLVSVGLARRYSFGWARFLPPHCEEILQPFLARGGKLVPCDLN